MPATLTVMDPKTKRCEVCSSIMKIIFKACVLHKYDVYYYHCKECGFLQTENPFWLNEAYSDAIAVADTGIMQRNIYISQRLAPLLFFCFGRFGRYVDVAGGYGILVRLMRDMGFDYYWDDKYCRNLLARGFEVGTSDHYTALTAFEVLEHVHNPIEFINDTMTRYNSDTLICSTRLYEGALPPTTDWWYYSFDTGQHISFYQKCTLQKIADRLNLKFYSTNTFQFFSKRELPHKYVFSLLSGRLSLLFKLYVQYRLKSLTLADQVRFKSDMNERTEK